MTKRIMVCIAVLAIFSGCGQKATSRTHSVISPAPVATAAPSAAAQTSSAAMDCGGAKPVWINERSHVYHLAGDPWYGKTKHGRYLCESDARKEGYHVSGASSSTH